MINKFQKIMEYLKLASFYDEFNILTILLSSNIDTLHISLIYKIYQINFY